MEIPAEGILVLIAKTQKGESTKREDMICFGSVVAETTICKTEVHDAS